MEWSTVTHGREQILPGSRSERTDHPWKHQQQIDFYPQSTRSIRPENPLSSKTPTRRVIEDEEGNTRGRNDKLRGQIGVSTIALNEGCTIGPPADSEYAVEPVGVETIRPSQTASVRCCPSTKTSIVFRCGLGPRWSATSFITCQPMVTSVTIRRAVKMCCGEMVGHTFTDLDARRQSVPHLYHRTSITTSYGIIS